MYYHLFIPLVDSGFVAKARLFGYREDRIYIRGSRHTPPPKDAVVDCMEALFECIDQESHPAAGAILGHYLFVYIHPYMDGNGRIARFLMNAIFAAGGYHWTVVQLENRKQYMHALSIADEHKDFQPFTDLMLSELKMSESYLKSN